MSAPPACPHCRRAVFDHAPACPVPVMGAITRGAAEAATTCMPVGFARGIFAITPEDLDAFAGKVRDDVYALLAREVLRNADAAAVAIGANDFAHYYGAAMGVLVALLELRKGEPEASERQAIAQAWLTTYVHEAGARAYERRMAKLETKLAPRRDREG